MRRLRLGGLVNATRLLFEQWLWIKHGRYNKDPLHAGQAACVRFNLRCIYSVCVCVCVAVKAEVISLIISSAFLYTSHLNLPSCTCLHFAPGEAEPPCGPGDRELHAVQGSYAQLGHNIKSAQRFWTWKYLKSECWISIFFLYLTSSRGRERLLKLLKTMSYIWKTDLTQVCADL